MSHCQVKSAYELVAQHTGAYPRFPKHEAARSIFTPPGWDASPSLSVGKG